MQKFALLQAQNHRLHAVPRRTGRCRQCHRAKQTGARQVVPRTAHLLRVIELALAEGELPLEQRSSCQQVGLFDRHRSEIHPLPRRHRVRHRHLLPARIEVHLIAHARMGEALAVEPHQQLSLVTDDFAIAKHLAGGHAQSRPQDRRQQGVLAGELNRDSGHRPLSSAVDLQRDMQFSVVVDDEPGSHDVYIHVTAAAVEVLDL